MQNFDIVRKSTIENTFRVSKIKNDFDVDDSHVNERFSGTIQFPDDWEIGLIVGGSGTGKSTIARELFGDHLIDSYEYKSKSILDDMPQSATVDEITQMFYSVGFGSVPNWLKPYNALSTGEKMRCDLARAFLEQDTVVFDEYTSVVDRQVAQVISMTIRKMIDKKAGKKKFVAVSCHRDVTEYLEPDWVFDTDIMKQTFTQVHDQKKGSYSEVVNEKNGESLAVIII